VAGAHRRFAPGRLLRGHALGFETRATAALAGAEIVVRLNRAEIGHAPLGEAFEPHRVELPEARVRDGMNELRFEVRAPAGTDPGAAKSAGIALRRVGVEGAALR
jgi:hypothetical protein